MATAECKQQLHLGGMDMHVQVVAALAVDELKALQYSVSEELRAVLRPVGWTPHIRDEGRMVQPLHYPPVHSGVLWTYVEDGDVLPDPVRFVGHMAPEDDSDGSMRIEVRVRLGAQLRDMCRSQQGALDAVIFRALTRLLLIGDPDMDAVD